MLFISEDCNSQLWHVMGCSFYWGTRAGPVRYLLEMRVVYFHFRSELHSGIHPLFLGFFVLCLVPMASKGTTKKNWWRLNCSGVIQLRSTAWHLHLVRRSQSFIWRTEQGCPLCKHSQSANTPSPRTQGLLAGSHRWARVEALCLSNPHLTPHWRKP